MCKEKREQNEGLDSGNRNDFRFRRSRVRWTFSGPATFCASSMKP